MQVTSHSAEATHSLAQRLGELVQANQVIGLIGDLGAGKTLFVQGLARGLGIPETVRVVSPTFTILNEVNGGRLPLFHCDLYRIAHEDELEEIGLDHAMSRGGVTAVEWCDRFDALLADRIVLDIAIVGDDVRRFSVSAKGANSERCLALWVKKITSDSRQGVEFS